MFEFFAYIVMPLAFGWGAYLVAKGMGMKGTSARPLRHGPPPKFPPPPRPFPPPPPRRYSRYARHRGNEHDRR